MAIWGVAALGWISVKSHKGTLLLLLGRRHNFNAIHYHSMGNWRLRVHFRSCRLKLIAV